MGVPRSIDLSARTGPCPIRDLVPAGFGPTARSDPLSIGGEDSVGCDRTATSAPPSENGDGAMPSPLNRPDGIPDCCLLSGNTLGGGVSSTGAGRAAGTAETIGGHPVSTVSLDQSSLSLVSLPSSAITSPLPSPYLPVSPPTASSCSSSIPGPVRHLIAATIGDYSGQPKRVTVDNIDSSSVVEDPASSFSCCLLGGTLQDLEI